MCGCEHLFGIDIKYAKLEKLYYELLWAVETKIPEETRHETALRYIQEAENRDCGEDKCGVGIVGENQKDDSKPAQSVEK